MILLNEIAKVGAISVEEFRRDFLIPHMPVVIEGGITDWPAFRRWTDEYLFRFCGDEKVIVKPKCDYAGGESKREIEAAGEVDLRKAIRYMMCDDASDLTYVRETRILEKLPKLREDVIDPPYMPDGTHPIGPLMWIGPSGTRAQLHWDPWNNLFGQLRGRKKFILVPHEQHHLTCPNTFPIGHTEGFRTVLETRPQLITKMRRAVRRLEYEGLEVNQENYREELARNLEPEDVACLMAYLHDINNCHVDAENPDLETHPEFAGADRFEFVLEAGDLLYIPYGYLHYVRSLAPSISINWFFDPTPEERSLYEDMVRIALDHLEP